MDKEHLLYRYFSNSLTAEELITFNEVLETDDGFKAEFEFQKRISQATRESRHKEMRLKLQEFESTVENQAENPKSGITMWKVAASIALFIIATYFISVNLSQPDYEELYASNFSTFPNTVYVITRSDTINSPERDAFVAYESGNYEDALAKMNQIQEKDYTPFFKAQILLNLDRSNEAERLLKNMVKSKATFSSESLWYLALIQIKEKNEKEARKYLEQLLNQSNYKKDEATALLKELP